MKAIGIGLAVSLLTVVAFAFGVLNFGMAVGPHTDFWPVRIAGLVMWFYMGWIVAGAAHDIGVGVQQQEADRKAEQARKTYATEVA